MKKSLIFLIILILLVGIVSVYFLLNKGERNSDSDKEKYPMSNLSGKKVAMVIAFKDFRDEEYFIPREILEKAGVEIRVVSDEMGTALGTEGGEAQVDIKISDLNVSEFDVVMFIGGPGALEHLDNQDSYKIAKDTINKNKVLAAICVSPTILAKAGVLSGKKATVWTGPIDKQAKKVLEDNGAVYSGEDVVVDGDIVTANGPGAAEEFGKAVVEVLSK